MSIRNLEYLFQPKSVAVIGASRRPNSVGAVVMQNLLQGGFAGPVLPVNPKYSAVGGVLAYPNLASLPVVPEMAVICTPPATVPGLVAELAVRGTRAAIVLTAGVSPKGPNSGLSLRQAMLDAARPHGLRILGPNCLGVLVPAAGLNASFSHRAALPGLLAFVSQSGALCTAVLDWARSSGIGFSHFISLGDLADVDFGDCLDYLGSESSVAAILLYIESVTHARKFMSAARAAARSKPVLAVKAGRVAEGARAVTSHTGSLAGADDVYQAAFDRAGMLRVFSIDELFDAVETLARSRPLKGDRLAILTNGGGPGVMATDALIAAGGQLARLSADTISQLDAVLPATWSRGNPVDMIGDAPGKRYAAALETLTHDPNIDAILVLHAPTAIASSEDAARAVVESVRGASCNILTSWLGRDAVSSARRLLADAGIPTYETPDHAVRGFMHMVNYRRNQELVMQTPPSIPVAFTPQAAAARRVIDEALGTGRTILSEPEAKAVLAAYGVPVVETRVAAGAEEAVRVANELGYPVAVKIVSAELTHKSDVGGVALDLEQPDAVSRAVAAIIERIARQRPDAHITGFAVQRMARRPGAVELIVGVATDPLFGPVILFGQGGTAVEVIADRALALPPLNMHLARELISRTHVFKLLQGYRDRPAADLDAICLTLIQVSQLIVDMAELAELDINPLYADAGGVLALDARIRLAPGSVPGTARLAIRPYPQELEEYVRLPAGRRIFLRPIRPEDEAAHQAFLNRLTPDDKRFRFFGAVREFSHLQLARFTQNDYDREMAFIATVPDESGRMETVGVVRSVSDPDNVRAEFAIVVRSDLKRQGLGRALMDKMIRYCRGRGLRELWGQVLVGNEAMLHLARSCGFTQRALPQDGAFEVVLQLDAR